MMKIKSLEKKKLILLITVTALLVHTFFGTNIPADKAAATRGLDAVSHTQEELREYYRTHPIQDLKYSFAEEPSITAPYSMGEVDNACLQDALNLLNMYRLIAGVDPVEITAQAQEYAQAAALVCAVKRELTHGISGPADMDEDLSAKAAYGSFNSNIAGGGETLTSMIRRFMLEINGDPDFGHRRQLLDYNMTETGFGVAESSSGSAYMATYVDANLYEKKVISYPGENQPLEFFGTGYAWTVTVPQKLTEEDVLVTVTDTKTNRTWTSSLAQNNMRIDSWGGTYCLIFAPEDIKYREGDRYRVDITGIPEPITYYVNMFLVGDRIPVESVKRDVAGIGVYADPDGTGTGSYSQGTLRATVLPENATNKNIDWVSADPSIAYPVWNGSSSCKVVALKTGEVTITAITEDGGYTADYTVTVRPKAEEIILEDEYTIGVGQSLTLYPEVLPKESRSRAGTAYTFDKSIISVEETIYLGQRKITGLKKGTTELKWYADSNYDVKKTCRINVVDPVYINKLTMNKDSVEFFKNDEVQLEVSIEPENATLKDIEWTTSSRYIAEVDNNGHVTQGSGAGTAIITAKALDGSGVTATCEIVIHRHSIDNIAKVPATCVEDGIEEYWKCSSCGKLFSNKYANTVITEPVVIPAKGHTWKKEYTVDKEASCTEEGVESIHCSVCDEIKEGSERVIDKKEHSYGEWTATKEATCTDEGLKEKVCESCGDTVTEVIDANGHTLIPYEAVEVSCIEDGKKTYWECSECKKIFADAEGKTETTEDDLLIKASGHKLAYHESVESTTEKEGNTEFWLCDECGKFFSDAEGKTEIAEKDTVIPKIVHNLTLVPEKKATCTEDGNTAYYTCSHCDKLFEDENAKKEITLKDTVIKAEGHKLTYVEAIEPTTEKDGNTEFWLCDECGKYFSDVEGKNEIAEKDTVIPKIVHNLTLVPEKKATCTEDGNKAYYTCLHCDKLFEDENAKNEITLKDTVVKSEGHKLTHVEAKEPTVEEDGNIEYWVCSVCGKLFSDADGKNEIREEDIKITKYLDITKATVSGLATKAYTGEAITPEVTVKHDGVILKKGTDYTVAYADNTKAGAATVTIKGIGDYAGTITKKFLIKQVSLKYRAYVQKKNWMSWSTAKVSGTEASKMAGTTDNLRMETIQMQLSGVGGAVEYRAYCAKKGWTQWATTADTTTYAGTKGEARRVEMIQLRAKGQVANLYDMYFRTYCEKFGWLNWAKDGEKAGTQGYAYKLEAFQVNFVRKGETFKLASQNKKAKSFYDKTRDGADPE